MLMAFVFETMTSTNVPETGDLADDFEFLKEVEQEMISRGHTWLSGESHPVDMRWEKITDGWKITYTKVNVIKQAPDEWGVTERHELTDEGLIVEVTKSA